MKHEKAHEPGHEGHEHTEIAGIQFEETDINYRPITLAAIYGTVVTVTFVALAWGTFQYLRGREAALSPPANPLAAKHARKEPPEPRLQADPRADLLALRAAEDAALSKLAWVNRRNGIVQVPIERAMEIVVSKGLPVRATTAPAAAPAARSTSSAPAAVAADLAPSTAEPALDGKAPSMQPAHPGAQGDTGTSAPRPDDAHDPISPEERP
ncbi:MAG TPA: hypothetical protein VEC57_17470 [Candidatus Limnocylindrales bacterium]|nr:hypothetical protein [Candidatus Limnocylindrales bacterium]